MLTMIATLFAACGQTTNPDSEDSVELVVFAAASLQECMTDIAELYKTAAPNVTLTFNFDSSGTLKTQIQEGATCDMFISAGQKQVDQLDASADASVNTEGLDFVLAGSRFNFVENQVVLIVPNGSDKGIAAFEDVMTDKVALISLGNSDVPAGQYAEEIFTSLSIWEDLVASNKISYATNVKEVLAQVEAASVDCGVVYSTDAASSDGVTIVASAPADSHSPIIYPAAIINTTAHQAEAEAFAAFLKTAEVAALLEAAGFIIPE